MFSEFNSTYVYYVNQLVAFSISLITYPCVFEYGYSELVSKIDPHYLSICLYVIQAISRLLRVFIRFEKRSISINYFSDTLCRAHVHTQIFSCCTTKRLLQREVISIHIYPLVNTTVMNSFRVSTQVIAATSFNNTSDI